MGRFSNSMTLAKSSFAVLKSDKELMVIPVVSFVCSLIVGAAIALGVYFTFDRSTTVTTRAGTFTTTASTSDAALTPTPVTYVVGVVGYLALTFVVTFFAAALVAGAHERLTGGDPTLGSAFGAASKRLPQIFGWSLLAGTVGLIIQSIEERAGLLGSIIGNLLDVAWRLATWLAIPVLVVEGTGPMASLKRAASLFKQTWGENLIAQAGFGLVGLLVVLPGVLVGALLIAVVPIVGIIVLVVWIVGAAIVLSTLNGIYRTALYLYASGQSNPWFPQEVMAGAFRPKTSRFR